MTARDIMTKDFSTLLPSSTIRHAVSLFKFSKRNQDESGVNALMIVDEQGKLIGMITMSHILRAIIPFYMEMGHLAEFAWEGLYEKMCKKLQDKPVSDYMEKKIVTIDPDRNIFEIAEIMLKKRIRRIPVVEGGKVIGIVYRREMFFRISETMIDREYCI